MELLKKIFGKQPETDYMTLVNEGASILDVRTKAEYAEGHVPDSLNIPLRELNKAQMQKHLPVDKPVIICCQSGMRAGQAKRLLENEGYNNVFNVGNWASLMKKI
ncbi:rhodanese-like domain-containing protein [Limibacter armeniacum]|uniref:rhodanese-like domain-containing protein n=1 Tax=Limibacter armeniacum TaxID=466084 RepID=UPI002FE569F1